MSIKTSDIYSHLYDELETTRRARSDAEQLAQVLRRKETRLGGMLILLRDQTCMACHGKGEVWTSYAQDDTKMEKCNACDGTGEHNG